MSESTAPGFIDPDDHRFAIVNGRRMARIMGGDGTEVADDAQDTQADQPAPELESTETTQTDTAPEAEVVDYFSESFDPASLHDDLRPGWKQIHGRYTQKFQELAEERKTIEEHQQLLGFLQSDDPEERALALQALGYDLDPGNTDEDELEDAEDNEIAQLRQQIDDLTSWRDNQQQTAQAAQYETAVNEFLDESWDTLKKQTGRDDFTEKEELLLEQVAAANPDDEGLPSLENAYELVYGDVLSTARKNWLKKKQPQPQPGDGSSGTPQVDLSDDNARIRLMAEAIDAGGD